MRSRRCLVLALALASTVLVTLATPERASACVYGGCDGIIVAVGVVALSLAVMDLVVLGADLDAATRGRWVAPGWAVANLIMSAMNAGAAAILFGAANWGTDHGTVGAGFALAATSLLMATIGILSLALREDDEPATTIRDVRMTFAPVPAGGAVALAGRF